VFRPSSSHFCISSVDKVAGNLTNVVVAVAQGAILQVVIGLSNPAAEPATVPVLCINKNLAPVISGNVDFDAISIQPLEFTASKFLALTLQFVEELINVSILLITSEYIGADTDITLSDIADHVNVGNVII
jgi:hypothetical protein